MRVLVAPQEFKGSLTAKAAAEAIVAGLRRAVPGLDLDLLPLADGGPGTLDALVVATGGQVFEAHVQDPLLRPRSARWGGLGGQSPETAVIEMAEASGLVLLSPEERDPGRASTYGTGELLLAALDAGYRRIILGIGGSATNDGGAGAARALGVRLLSANNAELRPGGLALEALEHIDVSTLDPRLRECEVIIAADVTNPLCGSEGATFVYGPQKGASEDMVKMLDAALRHFAEVILRELAVDLASAPGAGAAGGLGYGLMVFCGAHVQPGFEVVSMAVGLRDRIDRADLVITGEGRLDRQSAFGKTTVGVARTARDAGKRVVVIAGSIQDGAAEPFDAAYSLTAEAAQEESMTDAQEILESTAERACRELLRRGLVG